MEGCQGFKTGRAALSGPVFAEDAYDQRHKDAEQDQNKNDSHGWLLSWVDFPCGNTGI